MRDLRVIPVGTDLRSWVLPGGTQITAITIDNKSGSWLLIPQDNTYIAPYTLGFAHNFSPSILRIDILFVDGPAGQVSTLAGDSPVASIYDTNLRESAGVASQGAGFVEGFTQTFSYLSLITVARSLNTNGTMIAAIANKRIRVLTLGLAVLQYGSVSNSAAVHDLYANSIYNLSGNPSGDIYESGMVGANNRDIKSEYPLGLDIAVSDGLDYTFFAPFTHTLRLYLKATYVVI